MKKETGIVNISLRKFFLNALRISLNNFSQANYFLKTVLNFRRAEKKRAIFKRSGIHVPPILIFSVTNRCNLRCKGCYHWAFRSTMEEELNGEQLHDIIHQADEIGISFIVFAGGKPFMRKEILEIAAKFPDIIFLVFTNGLLIDNEVILKLKTLKNLIPVISIEGYESETDSRRGAGVFDRLMNIMEQLKNNKIFYSLSITLTSHNYDSVMVDEYINKLYNIGGRLFFFIEYTPIKKGTEDWLLTDGQRQQVMSRVKEFRNKYKGLFISVPGDEEEIGGCLSAGRGFVHISASGNVEPCPFAPYSDTNVKETPLIEALQSEFLKKIREGSSHLHETEGGCALWVEREWVKAMLQKEHSPKYTIKEETLV